MQWRPCAAAPVFVCVVQSSAVAQSISLALDDALARACRQSITKASIRQLPEGSV